MRLIFYIYIGFVFNIKVMVERESWGKYSGLMKDSVLKLLDIKSDLDFATQFIRMTDANITKMTRD